MRSAAPALVVGGGIAGAAIAAQFARAGRSVVLIERQAGPHHKVCGEFVSGEAALYLQDLGIDLMGLGAVRLRTVRLHAGHRVATARLPFPAYSVSRSVLDEALLCAASASGAEVHRGRGVRSLRAQGAGWIAELDGGETLSAADVFLATGKHDLRGWKRPPGAQDDLIAFKLHWRLGAEETAALGAGVELTLFPGGYAGLEPVENGVTNLCLVVRKAQFIAAGQRWDRLLALLRSACSSLDRRLADATPCWSRPLALAFIPYGHVAALGRGVWLVGDQAAVIPSFSGDGIAIALHSARLAARFYLAGQSACAFQLALARDVAGQVRRATWISRALVHPFGQTLAAAATHVAPGLLAGVARITRVATPRVGNARGKSIETRSP
jgi:menaquinone-9 beta-reductase